MRTRRIASLGALMLALVLINTACIRSRVQVTSDPPGASVKFQNYERGATPITIPFLWYWHYDIEVSKPGYKPVKTSEYFATPPWFLFPLDFFFEVLPVPVPDTRHRHYKLEPESVAQSQPTP